MSNVDQFLVIVSENTPLWVLLHSSSKEMQHGKLHLFFGRVQIDGLFSVFRFANALGNNV